MFTIFYQKIIRPIGPSKKVHPAEPHQCLSSNEDQGSQKIKNSFPNPL